MIEDLHHHRAGLSMLNTYDALLLLRRVGQNEFRMSQIVMRDPAEIPLPSRRLPPTGDVVGIGPSTMRIAAEPLGGERPGATDTQTRLIHHRNSVLKLHVALLILARDLQPTTEGWGYWVRHLEMIAKDKRKKEDDDEGGNSSPSKRRKRTNTSTTQGRETDSASGSGVGGAQETGEDAHPHEGVVSRRCANDDAGRDHGHNDHRDRKDNDDNEVYDEEAPSLTLSIDSGDAQSQNHDPKTPTSSTFLNVSKSRSLHAACETPWIHMLTWSARLGQMLGHGHSCSRCKMSLVTNQTPTPSTPRPRPKPRKAFAPSRSTSPSHFPRRTASRQNQGQSRRKSKPGYGLAPSSRQRFARSHPYHPVSSASLIAPS